MKRVIVYSERFDIPDNYKIIPIQKKHEPLMYLYRGHLVYPETMKDMLKHDGKCREV